MMKLTKLLIILMLGLVSVMTYAQGGEGQVCVRAFEDRNESGTFDANEPLITQGISVNLMNALGVTVESKLLADSPTAAQGVVCFQQLLVGDYMVLVTSADYSATTPTTFNATVVQGSVPVRFDFGGELIGSGASTDNTASNNASAQASEEQVLQGILFGIIGAIIIMGFMTIIGMVIYFGVFHRRMNRVMSQGTGQFRPVTGPMPAYNPDTGSMPAYNQPGTGPMPAYNQPDTGSMPVYRSTPPTTGSMPAVETGNPLLNRDPNEGSPPLFNEEDTDQMGSIKD